MMNHHVRERRGAELERLDRAYGHYRRRARLFIQHAHLAYHFTGAQLGQDCRLPAERLGALNTHPTLSDDVQHVTGIALVHDGLTGREAALASFLGDALETALGKTLEDTGVAKYF